VPCPPPRVVPAVGRSTAGRRPRHDRRRPRDDEARCGAGPRRASQYPQRRWTRSFSGKVRKQRLVPAQPDHRRETTHRTTHTFTFPPQFSLSTLHRRATGRNVVIHLVDGPRNWHGERIRPAARPERSEEGRSFTTLRLVPFRPQQKLLADGWCWQTNARQGFGIATPGVLPVPGAAWTGLGGRVAAESHRTRTSVLPLIFLPPLRLQISAVPRHTARPHPLSTLPPILYLLSVGPRFWFRVFSSWPAVATLQPSAGIRGPRRAS